MTERAYVQTQITRQLKAEFLAAIADEYDGTSDFFRRRIREKCNVETRGENEKSEPAEKGFIALNASVTPEQRAALLAQCQKEGKTMGTWMRDEIKAYLASKKEQ